jgi:hypothetical protein
MNQPSDYHRHPALTVRPPRAVQDAAKQALTERGWTMQDFMTACLAAVGAEPEATLERIAGHRVAPNRRGRPAKTDSAESSDR